MLSDKQQDLLSIQLIERLFEIEAMQERSEWKTFFLITVKIKVMKKKELRFLYISEK
jgi:hypothetical protein